jgi:hypothetical protein
VQLAASTDACLLAAAPPPVQPVVAASHAPVPPSRVPGDTSSDSSSSSSSGGPLGAPPSHNHDSSSSGGSVSQEAVADADASNGVVGHSSGVVSLVGAVDGGPGECSEFSSPRLRVFGGLSGGSWRGGFVPVASQVGFTPAAAAAAAQPVQSPERTAGGLDQA